MILKDKTSYYTSDIVYNMLPKIKSPHHVLMIMILSECDDLLDEESGFCSS